MFQLAELILLAKGCISLPIASGEIVLMSMYNAYKCRLHKELTYAFTCNPPYLKTTFQKRFDSNLQQAFAPDIHSNRLCATFMKEENFGTHRLSYSMPRSHITAKQHGVGNDKEQREIWAFGDGLTLAHGMDETCGVCSSLPTQETGGAGIGEPWSREASKGSSTTAERNRRIGYHHARTDALWGHHASLTRHDQTAVRHTRPQCHTREDATTNRGIGKEERRGLLIDGGRNRSTMLTGRCTSVLQINLGAARDSPAGAATKFAGSM